jgi:L-lactate dehydrogenase complex protein LldG
LPALDGPWTQYPDPKSQFVSVLELIGGNAVSVATPADLRNALAQLPQYSSATQIGSSLHERFSGDAIGNVDLNAVADPHELEQLDIAVLSGEFGVAENGAIWVANPNLKHRAVYFLVQHLALVIFADQIVHNMHEAYQRIEFNGPGFGLFIAGPSKTADIEQSLVIGAHGARSLTVFIVE